MWFKFKKYQSPEDGGAGGGGDVPQDAPLTGAQLAAAVSHGYGHLSEAQRSMLTTHAGAGRTAAEQFQRLAAGAQEFGGARGGAQRDHRGQFAPAAGPPAATLPPPITPSNAGAPAPYVSNPGSPDGHPMRWPIEHIAKMSPIELRTAIADFEAKSSNGGVMAAVRATRAGFNERRSRGNGQR